MFIKKIRINKYVKLFLKLAITVAALYLVFRKIDINQVLTTYKDSNFLLLFVALPAFMFSQIASSYRLNNFLRAVDVKISEASNMKLFLLGMYYNLFLPGGIGGDGYKIYLLNKRFKTSAKQLFSAILLDRVNGLTALVCTGSVLTVFIEPFGICRYLSLIIFPVGILAHYIFIKKLFRRFISVIPKTITFSFIKAILQLICAWFILWSFGDINNWFYYLFLFLISSIVAMFPITIGGIGARELTFLYGAEILKLDVNIALAVSFMFYLMTVLVSFSGIYYSFHSAKVGILDTNNTNSN